MANWLRSLARAIVAGAISDYAQHRRPAAHAEAKEFLFGTDPDWIASREAWCRTAGVPWNARYFTKAVGRHRAARKGAHREETK